MGFTSRFSAGTPSRSAGLIGVQAVGLESADACLNRGERKARDQRRLAAIVSADVAGYSRLMGRDEGGTLAALKAHRRALIDPKISEYGGRIVKTTGDGLLLEFASVVDAVRCAVDVQRGMAERNSLSPTDQRVDFRIGINVGDIIIDGDDIYGDGVNVAARLQALADPGEIYVSKVVRDQVLDKLSYAFDDLGAQHVKNIARPVEVYRVDLQGEAEGRGRWQRLTHGPWRWVAAGILALGVVGVASWTLPQFWKSAAPAAPPSHSIAVLPFADLSAEKDQEYFADGLAEELLDVLSKIHGLRVTSRTSAFSFKGSTVDIPTVARKLNVRMILEGSVRKAGKRVRINAQLIDVATDSHLWSEVYDRDLEDILAVQDDIAQAVVKALRVTLLGRPGAKQSDDAAAADVRKAATGRSENAEAFQLYLQGKFYGERLTQADTDKAIELFQRALAIDPNFALAWTGLAHVHWTRAGIIGPAPRDESYERAREAAQHALHLAPDLAEAHTELGYVQQSRDWNWTAAEASYRRALELAPGNANALFAAARLAQVLGRLDDARELARKAVALDPLSPWKHSRLGWISLDDERFEDAAASFQLALDLAPNAGSLHAGLAAARLLQGRKQEALSIAQAESKDGDRYGVLAMIHHSLEHPAESDAALKALIDGYASMAQFQIAEIYAYRNEVDKAFEWLERAYAERDPGVTFVLTDRFLHSLHGDPRWQPFLRKMKLVDSHS